MPNTGRRIILALVASAIAGLLGCGCGTFNREEQARFDSGCHLWTEAKQAIKSDDLPSADAAIHRLFDEWHSPQRKRGTFYFGNAEPELAVLLAKHAPTRVWLMGRRDELSDAVFARTASSDEERLWLWASEQLKDDASLVHYASTFQNDRRRMALLTYEAAAWLRREEASGNLRLVRSIRASAEREAARRRCTDTLVVLVTAPVSIPFVTGFTLAWWSAESSRHNARPPTAVLAPAPNDPLTPAASPAFPNSPSPSPDTARPSPRR